MAQGFYPTGMAQRLELEYASRQMGSIEINGSFYSLQRLEGYRAWRDQTPVVGPSSCMVNAMSDQAGVDALGEQVVRLTRSSHAMRSQMAARGQDAVEWAAYGLLFQLAKDGPKRSSALAYSACVDPSTVSRQVGQLVTAGLVERQADPEDGRATLLAATPAGHEVYAAKLERRRELFSRLVHDWSAQDVDTFTDLLRRLNDSVAALRSTLLVEVGPESRSPEETA